MKIYVKESVYVSQWKVIRMSDVVGDVYERKIYLKMDNYVI